MPRHNRSAPHVPFQPAIPCQRKRRFVSEAAALAAVEQASTLDIALELKVYRCPYCSGWHLSSVKQPRK